MANRCFFEMRIKGRKIDCEDFYRDLTYSIEDYISYEGGDSNDYIMEIEGECKNSIRYSMLKTSQELSLEAKSGLLNLEIEVFGKDDECDEYVEYIYLKNGKRKEERYGKELLYIWKIELNLEKEKQDHILQDEWGNIPQIGQMKDGIKKEIVQFMENLKEEYSERKLFWTWYEKNTLKNIIEKGLEKNKENTFEICDKLLVKYGFEEWRYDIRLLRNKVIYKPKDEPKYIKSNIKFVLDGLDKLYPDAVISETIIASKNEKLLTMMKWCCFALGYNTLKDFMSAYGYTYNVNEDFSVNKNGTIRTYFGMGGDVIIPEGVKKIERFKMENRGIVNLYISKTVQYIEYCPDIRPLDKYIVDCDNLHFKSIDGVLYSKDGKELIDCPSTMGKTINIPEGVEIVFGIDRLGVENIIIPKTVKEIRELHYGNYVVDENNKFYTSIDGALYSKDLSVLYRCSKFKTGTFVIPKGVKTIYHYAFENCKNLELIEVPESVKILEAYAFNGCNSRIIFQDGGIKWNEWITGYIPERNLWVQPICAGNFVRTEKRLSERWEDALEKAEMELVDYAYVALYQRGWIETIDKKMEKHNINKAKIFDEMIRLLKKQKEIKKLQIENLIIYIKRYKEMLESEQIEEIEKIHGLEEVSKMLTEVSS